ncbi:MAG TPA: CoA transferase, partial [Dehalococcoidia bacterium]|nr:CoA transferase [Dehalococcoidia bacterium]
QPTRRRPALSLAPSGLYPCAPGGPNDYLYLSIVTSRMWDTLCVAMGRPGLATDPRFETPQARGQHTAELRQEITDWTNKRDKHEAMKVLADAGVPASAVFDTVDIFSDPHLNARGFFKTVEHPIAGPVRLMSSPLRMSSSQTPITRAPLLGEHSEEILRTELALTDADLLDLRQQGVIPQALRPD